MSDKLRINYSRKVAPLLTQVNTLLRDALDSGIDANIFVKQNDPISGKAPIVYVDFFSR